MDEYQWAKPFRRRCRARLHKELFVLMHHGRCDLRRGHDGRHALERGLEVTEFWIEHVTKLSAMGEFVVAERIRERKRDEHGSLGRD